MFAFSVQISYKQDIWKGSMPHLALVWHCPETNSYFLAFEQLVWLIIFYGEYCVYAIHKTFCTRENFSKICLEKNVSSLSNCFASYNISLSK